MLFITPTPMAKVDKHFAASLNYNYIDPTASIDKRGAYVLTEDEAFELYKALDALFLDSRVESMLQALSYE